MLTAYEARRNRLRYIIELRFDSSVSKFAVAVGRTRQQISKLISDPKNKTAKDMGHHLARDFENSLNLPVGYFDQTG